ncbi:GNAT family N-acetyltransferase [Rhizobium sp. XQZ8]|uniref:GNAT family N-acetyltransferase n=1 Tax=Rhizobium populisoli TaxID=2859785 RepID=UPI001CA55A07|nr:GNAT family N-acetyltransferase [Rhizobium populisoli]MBW6426014.1 GNAT family N-acetyltransferase [Rhizobium populisoli]
MSKDGPSSPTQIRPATAADVRALGGFGARLTALHHEFDPRRFIAPTPGTPAAYAAFLRSQIGRPETVLLVALTEDNLSGYVWAGVEGTDYMSLRGPAGVVYDLFVDPARRRNGIGRLLLRAGLTLLEQMGAERVVLSTAHRNEAAQALFTSLGFRPTMIEMTRESGTPT